MSEIPDPDPKPRPARWPAPDSARGQGDRRGKNGDGGGRAGRSRGSGSRKGHGGGGGKLRPARELAGTEPPQPLPQPDIPEALVEVGDSTWLVRVLGRGGGGRAGTPPLLLLGFFHSERPGSEPAHEVTVAANALSELTQERFEAALMASSPPPPSGRRKPFFDGAGQARRGGSPS